MRTVAVRAALIMVAVLASGCGSDPSVSEPSAPAVSGASSSSTSSSSTVSASTASASTSPSTTTAATSSPTVTTTIEATVGASFPVDADVAAFTLQPEPFAVLPAGAIATMDDQIVILHDGVLETFDHFGQSQSSVPTTLVASTMLAGPDGLLYLDRFLADQSSTRVITAIDPASGAVVAENPVQSDPGGESEPFLGAGRAGIVDRINDTLVVPYAGGVEGTDLADFTERWSEAEPTDVVVVRGEQRWVVPIVPSPDAAELYGGNPFPFNGPAGQVFFTTWIGPAVPEAGSDTGTPSGQVIVELHDDGSGTWYRLADDWRTVSADDTGVLFARRVDAGLELAWGFELPSD